jgi:dephospho-CoA kinase
VNTTTASVDNDTEIVESWLPQYIGLHGFAGAGKDAVAKILANYGYTRVAFADVLREALYVLNPVILFHPYGEDQRVQDLVDRHGWDEAKRQYEEIRRMLQVLGTEVGREMIDQNVWVDSVFKKLEEGKKYVFTDVRFVNEHQAIDSRIGLLVKIDRPGYGPVNAHKSDKGLPDEWFDVRINNDGTLEDLNTKVREILRLA